MPGERSRIVLLPVVATGFCAVGLITAFAGLRAVIGSGSAAKLWLVLFVAAGVAALVLVRTARDTPGRVRLGIAWTLFAVIVVATTIVRTPNSRPGVLLGSGWAVLIAGGGGVFVGGVLLAVSPLVRPAVNRVIVGLAVAGVCALQVGGYLGAVAWTNDQNVKLTVADSAPLTVREPVLDGSVRWSAQESGEQLGTAGGVLTTLPDGLAMLDPATGAPRWTYHRADVGAVMTPVASSDGTLVAAIAVAPSLNPKPADIPARRLLVLDAVSGAVRSDAVLDPRVQGDLNALGSSLAYFTSGPDGIRALQISAVALTGPHAGSQVWAYYPKDACAINAVSALGTEVALSSTCGTVAMIDQDGTPRWEYRAPEGGAQIWPLAGAPAGTVQVVTEPGTVGDPAGDGVSAPSSVLSLDARTGAVRWQDNTLPKAPFTPDSVAAATGTLGTIWAGETAVLVYDLPAAQQVWLLGRPGSAKTWSATVPGLFHSVAPPGSLGLHVAVTPDGRIVLPTQNDANSPPGVRVVDGRTGRVTPNVPVDGARGIAGTTGFFDQPIALSTPGGMVLAMLAQPSATKPTGPTRLLVGLR